jgi:uncharacterized protein (TIGR03437 family)
MQNCVLRKSSLWCAHTVFSLNNPRTMVQWWQIDPAMNQIQQTGRIDDPTGVTFYAYPSIAVNKNTDVLIGYSRFSGTQYASADYSMRIAADPPNTLRADTVFKLGEASYDRAPGDLPSNRWGDFSATMVDPLDDTGFWTIQEYAASPLIIATFGIDRWGTWWAQLVPLPAGAPPCVYSVVQPSLAAGTAGGAGSVGVTTAATCPWMAASNVPWIVLQDGTPGTGPGSVHFTVGPNDKSVQSRSGTITLAGQTFTVVQAGVPALPDLTINDLTAPTSASIGSDIRVVAIVGNIGGVAATPFRVAFYLSKSAGASAVPPAIGSCVFDKGLAAGAADLCSTSFTIPLSLAPGVVYVSALADDLQVISEVDKTNNFRLATTGPITLKFDPLRPTLTSPAVVNAASLLSGPISPGMIAVVSGLNFGPAVLTNGAPNDSGKLDTLLAETQLLFDGVAAPIVSVSREQMKAIVPYSVAGKKSTQVQVQFRGVLSNVLPLPVADSAPAIFTSAGSDGQALMTNEDGSFNSVDNPASAGSMVVLYATGEGQTDPPGVDGQVPADVLPMPVLAVSAQIGGEDAVIVSAGAAQGQPAGLLQVTVVVPDDVSAADAVPVVLTVGLASSQVGVTMAVK